MDRSPPRNPCVLVVEDHADTLRYLSRLLRLQGYAVQEAATCNEALAWMEREPCEILVSDVSLPDRSGLDLMRELRSRRVDVRGVAVSGHTGPEHVKAAKDAGFEHHVAKPIRFDHLLKVIRDLSAAAANGNGNGNGHGRHDA
jgi:two-component system CheB/CheR fusion protein